MKKLSKQSCLFDLKTNCRISILMKILFSVTIISVFITPHSFSRQLDTNFGTVAFSAEIHDPFTGRKQELYSVLDSQNRTHIAWIKDNRNSRILMYSVVDGNSVTHYEVDTDSVFNQEKKHPVLVLDNNEKPHLAWFVRRDPSQSCCPEGNFAVMYAEGTDGNGVFNVSQVSTNSMNPSDNTATEYTDSYVNHMPVLMIKETGSVEVAYISNTYSSISYDSYLVIARKNGEGIGWQYEETLVLDDINTYPQDGVFFPPNSSETYYGLVKDISPDDIELVTNTSGSWTKTSITNDPDHDVDHPQIARDSQGNYHVFYFYNDRDLDKLFVKHLTLSGASVASTETIELNEYTPTNYIYATIDPITDDIYYAYTGFNSGYKKYLVYFEEGVKQEIMLREDETYMGYRVLNANNGFVSLVTANESKDSIYVTTNLFENGVVTTEFEGTYNGSATQDGIHIGTYTFEVTGNSLEGSYNGDSENFSFSGSVNASGNFSITINLADGFSINVNGSLSGNSVSGSWSDSEGESGTIQGARSTTVHDGDYIGSASVEGSEIGSFEINITNGLTNGTYTQDGDTTPANGFTDEDGKMSVNVIFDDESITTVNATISNGTITGTFFNNIEGSGIITGSKSNSVSNENVTQVPGSISLSQNYPNPFNPGTKISFELPEAGNISIEIYNLLGQKVLTVVNNRYNAGWHEISVDGSSLTSGLYIYRLVTPTTSIIKKMTLIK